MNNIMVDLETMGTGTNSAIISVGAVRFNTSVTDKFEKLVTLQSCIEIGLEMDAETVMWWLKQDDKAREKFTLPATTIEVCLVQFSEWIGDNAIVWGNGAAFDNALLSNAYVKAGLDRPWSYGNDRCYRTLKNMHPDVKLKRKGVLHCAVDDAESQALHLIDILSKYYSSKS